GARSHLRAVRVDARGGRHDRRSAAKRLGAAETAPARAGAGGRAQTADLEARPAAEQRRTGGAAGKRRARAGGAGTRAVAGGMGDGDEPGGEVIDTLRSGDATPEQAALAVERSAVIREAIAELSEREQLIVQHVYVEGRSARDVAELIRASESRISQVTRDIR